MKSMDSIICEHNHNILNSKQKLFGWNCRKKDSCPLNSKRLTLKVIYCVDVSTEAKNDQKFCQWWNFSLILCHVKRWLFLY